MRPLGLRARVVLAAIFVLAAGVVVIGITVNVLLTDRLTSDARAVLRARADAQLTTVVLRAGRVAVREGTGDEALNREAWVFADGRAVARPRASVTVDQAARSLQNVRSPTFRNVGSTVRLLAKPALAGDGRRRIATVVVALTLAPYEDTERIARLGTILLGLFVVFAGAGIAWRSAGAGLRPVREMARRADAYGDHALEARFDMGPPTDELTELAATLDGLLGRLEASVRREQRLSAEIAHELRTPLSGVRATAELGLLEGTPTSMGEALQTVIAGADRMNNVIGALLRASHDRSASSSTCLLAEAVSAAAEALAAPAGDRGITLTVDPPSSALVVGAEALLISQVISPVLENAIRHADARVQIRVRGEGHTAFVSVHDDGPGISDEQADAIFLPGRHTGGGSGAGLGLALVRRLAASLGGAVRVEPSLDGALVVLELPLVTANTPD